MSHHGGHYLIEPVACTPAASWEKGQVENQVEHVCENVFKPRIRCRDLAKLNQILARRCVEIAQSIGHPEAQDKDPLAGVRSSGERRPDLFFAHRGRDLSANFRG